VLQIGLHLNSLIGLELGGDRVKFTLVKLRIWSTQFGTELLFLDFRSYSLSLSSIVA